MSQENKALVRQYFEAGNALELERLLSYLDPIHFLNANMAKPPLGYEKGFQEFSEMIRRIPETFGESLQITIDDMTAEEDRVAVVAHSNAKAASGNTYSNNYHFLFKIKDGKIVRLDEYLCSMTMANLLDPSFWATKKH